MTDGYMEYHYWWARYKPTGSILIVEARKHEDDFFFDYEIAGSDEGFNKEDFEFLQSIEDYNGPIS